MPRADDLPSFEVSHHVNTPCPSNPLGIKGCGEAGAIGSPPAVINAITDAIGNNDLTMPATPQKVWAAVPGGKAAIGGNGERGDCDVFAVNYHRAASVADAVKLARATPSSGGRHDADPDHEDAAGRTRLTLST
jgi:hypothetical protein